MGAGDFLCKEAETPFLEHYLMAGVPGSISTNWEPILAAARECFCLLEIPSCEPRLHLRFWVDPKGDTKPPWPKPFFRGLDHLIFAGFDSQSSILVDLRTRRGIGRFSPAMGSDCAYWKASIFPVLISIMGATVGITELHCGCVVKNGSGLLLAGHSQSGKSTLALALAQAGYGYVSDDRTYCSEWDSRLVAWGLPTLLKLRPDAASWFQDLKDAGPATAPNGEQAFLIDPDRWPGVTRLRRCDPQWLVFLERQGGAEFDFAPMSRAEAAKRLERDLIAETQEATEAQHRTIEKLVKLPRWRLRYGEPPQSVAEKLDRLFGEDRGPAFVYGNARERLVSLPAAVKAARQDPLRRFTPTPFIANVPLLGRTVNFATDSSAVLARTLRAFERYNGTPAGQPDFRWRIINESCVQQNPPWPERSAFSDDGLRFINIGRRSFVAADLDAREGVGFLAEGLASDETGFGTFFLDDVLYLTAGILGFVAMSSACVALGDKGLLVFGPPNSGKTTSCYLAQGFGLEFLADQAIFLEIEADMLRAWGDLVPGAFRPEIVQFLPELEALTLPFRYRDFTFLHLRTNRSQTAARTHPVTPAACVFLGRGETSDPSLVPLSCGEFRRRLAESPAFKDDKRFALRQAKVLRALEKVPAYHLAFGSDPAAAASFFPILLSASSLQEATG